MKARALVVVAGLLVAGCQSGPTGSAASSEISKALASASAEERDRAIAAAAAAGAELVPPLAVLLRDGPPETTRAAQAALDRLVRGASAPARHAERAAIAAELCTLAARPDLPVPVRAHVVRSLALVGDDAETVRFLTVRLADADLAVPALFALEGIGGPAVARALLAARRGRVALPPGALVAALGTIGDPESVPALIEIGMGSGLEPAAARAALAAHGDPRALACLRPALERAEPGAERDWLRFVAASARRPANTFDGTLVDPEVLAIDYSQLLSSRSPATRAAAFAALCALPGQDLLDVAFDRLADDDASVRAAARRVLIDLTSNATDKTDPVARLRQLETRVDTAPPLARAEYLRVLAARSDHPDLLAARLIGECELTKPLVVRRTAIELMGACTDATVELALRELLRDGPADVRDVVAASLVQHARRRRTSGAPAEARAILHEIVQRETETSTCADALAELRGVAAVDSLAIVEPLAARSELRDAVFAVRLGVARDLRKTDAERARSLAQEVFTAASDRSTRQQAFKLLREMGADVQQLAAASGVVLAWHVLGPFEAATAETLGQHPFGGDGPDVTKPFPVRGIPTEWRRIESDDPDGSIDLRFLKPSHDAVAYALAEIERPEAGEAMLEIGSDDGCAVWLNGERVHANFTARALTPAEDKVKVSLRAGRNRLLVKVSQGGGDWGLAVRVAPAR